VDEYKHLPNLAEILKRRLVLVAHESAGPTEVTLPNRADWLHEVSQALQKIPPEKLASRGDFDEAASLLFRHAEATLIRAEAEGPSMRLGADEAGAMEALIAIDGSRPSLLLREGSVACDDPWIGKWKEPLRASSATIGACAASVGRIEAHTHVPGRRFGTGFVFDSSGLVLTAAHVLSDIKAASQHSEGGGIVDFVDGPVIDFCGEIESSGRQRLKIESGSPITANGPYVDAAVLKIRRLTEAEAASSGDEITELPSALFLRKRSFDDPPIVGTFCVIGFPERAPEGSYRKATGSEVDWIAVVERLFGGTFGVKRLAPGTALSQPVPSSSERSERRFAHDATTLFGSSGSPVFAWNDRKHPVFGVHVAGAVLACNFGEWIPSFSERLDRTVQRLQARA
jgi:serine protease